ncbi:radical SAM family protein [Beggiatoa sp. PS]|nr:radical SAM family protein [Beggiatoa sp. PS]
MKIYQIEISNLCNLTCNYCPHPTQRRIKGIMSNEIFLKSLELVQLCGQKQIYLHNFGEPLLHPLIYYFIKESVQQGIKVNFYTNGLLLDQSMLLRLVEAGLGEICISGHVRGELERVQKLIDYFAIPLKITNTFRPKKAVIHTWAEQVSQQNPKMDKDNTLNFKPCIFERENAVVILWDGRINICCIDSEGNGVVGTVNDYLSGILNYTFKPISLCQNCNLMRGYEQLG